MTPYDEALLIGFAGGLAAAAAIVFGLKVAREEADLKIPGSPDWPESPLRPLSDADIRILRVCDSCRRYMGETRTIEAGQHLNLLHDLCPRCAKRRAATVQTA